MTGPPDGGPPVGPPEAYDSEQTVILTPEQLADLQRSLARARAVKASRRAAAAPPPPPPRVRPRPTPGPRPQPYPPPGPPQQYPPRQHQYQPGPQPHPQPQQEYRPRHAAAEERPEASDRSVIRSSRIMMIASAVSRITGFVRNLAIAAAIGFGFVADSYHTANTLPNIVYELLLGGVLTSVVIPLLVHAQQRDPDGGEAYTQRLLSLATVVLVVATIAAVLAAPLLTSIYMGADSPKADLTTMFAWFLLPQILFYGLGAMFGAVLNTRSVFGPPAWAPVAGNLVIIAAALAFLLVPGPSNLTPDSITDTQVVVLGVGTTLGIVVQAVVLIPSLRRVGFHWRWRLGWRDTGLGEAGRLASWVLAYVVISQVGYAVQTRLANAVEISGNSYAVFTNASLLFQMPYGILGVALLTALMPRMSRAAARGDRAGVVADLSLGSRLSAVALMPISGLLIVLGPALGTVIFSAGQAGDGGRQVGIVLAASAFGLVPFAITMLQMRAFYALKDARTPTLINIWMILVKVLLSLGVAASLPDRHVVTGLAVVNSITYVIGAVIGEALLRRRLGRLDTPRVLRTCTRLLLASIVGALAAWAVLYGVSAVLGTGLAGSAVSLIVGGTVGGVVAVAAGLTLRVAEINEIVGLVRRRIRGA